jgi:GST-like protein
VTQNGTQCAATNPETKTMITLYSWYTPNGKKPAILLAELGLPYELKRVDLSKLEQKRDDYLAINPNGKIPALSDGPLTIFESGAILLHLAEKTNQLIPSTARGRAEVLSWLFWQVGGPGPFFGQVHHFRDDKPHDERAYQHFVAESQRLAHVLDRRLEAREYVCDEYSIADIALYPWFVAAAANMPEIVEGCGHLPPWLERMAARPAVKLGMALKQAP